MTNTKLAMIALALAALVAGALIVKHDAGVGGILLAVGGKLIGLTFPEVGAKKEPPAPPSDSPPVAAKEVFPQDMGGNPLELRVWPGVVAFGIVFACVLPFSFGCSSDRGRDVKTAIVGARGACQLYEAGRKHLPNDVPVEPEAEAICPLLQASPKVTDCVAAGVGGDTGK